ncbi:MAG: SDR family oxidoreductase [Stappiaceae bacterium]
MKIIVFGATGTLGRIIVEQALNNGHAVTAFTRTGQFNHANHPALDVVQGDVLDAAAVSYALSGHDAAICALGAGRKGGLRAAGTRHILAGMKEHGIRRFVCLSSLGVGDSAGNLNFFWKNIMFGLLLRPAYADHGIQETIVRNSELDWTIVRPAAFTDGPKTGAYKHGFSGKTQEGLQLKISRADAAEFMLAQLNSNMYLHHAPGVSY